MKFFSEEQKVLATGKHYKTKLSGFYYKIIKTVIKKFSSFDIKLDTNSLHLEKLFLATNSHQFYIK